MRSSATAVKVTNYLNWKLKEVTPDDNFLLQNVIVFENAFVKELLGSQYATVVVSVHFKLNTTMIFTCLQHSGISNDY